MYAGIDTDDGWLRLACVGLDGVPCLVADAQDSESLVTRDIVHVSGDGVLVGNPVLDLLLEQPDLRVTTDVFRQLGRCSEVLVDEQSRIWHPDTLAATVLKKLRRDYEARWDSSLERCAISVSPQSSSVEQNAMQQAARLAGFNEVMLLPSGLAVAAGSQVHRDSRKLCMLVCDVGQHNITVSVVAVTLGRLRLLACESSADVTLTTVQDAVRQVVTSQFREEHGGYDPQTDPAARWRLVDYIHQLTSKVLQPSGSFVEQSLLLGGRIATVRVSPSDVAAALQQLAMQVLNLSARAAIAAGLTASSINAVLVANEGGNVSALPGQIIQQFPTADSGWCSRLRPADLAAYGASLLAKDPDTTEDWLTPLDTKSLPLGSSIGVLGRHLDGTVNIETLIDAQASPPWRVAKTIYRSSRQQFTTVLNFVASGPKESEPVPIGKTEIRFTTDNVTIELEVTGAGEVIVTSPEGRTTVGHLQNTGRFLPSSQIDLFNTIQILN